MIVVVNLFIYKTEETNCNKRFNYLTLNFLKSYFRVLRLDSVVGLISLQLEDHGLAIVLPTLPRTFDRFGRRLNRNGKGKLNRLPSFVLP